MGGLIELASIVRDILSLLKGWGPALLTGGVAIWTSIQAAKISLSVAAQAMEVAKAGRADQINQPVFAAKLAAYQRLFGLIQRTCEPSKEIIASLEDGTPVEEEMIEALVEASNELDRTVLAESIMYAGDVIGTAKEFSFVVNLIFESMEAGKLDPRATKVELLKAAATVGVYIRESLQIPRLEGLTNYAVSAAHGVFDEDFEPPNSSP